jgi:hypothetical protein
MNLEIHEGGHDPRPKKRFVTVDRDLLERALESKSNLLAEVRAARWFCFGMALVALGAALAAILR